MPIITSPFLSKLRIKATISLSPAPSSPGTSAPRRSKLLNSPLYSSYPAFTSSTRAKDGGFSFTELINPTIASSSPSQTTLTLPSPWFSANPVTLSESATFLMNVRNPAICTFPLILMSALFIINISSPFGYFNSFFRY